MVFSRAVLTQRHRKKYRNTIKGQSSVDRIGCGTHTRGGYSTQDISRMKIVMC